MFKNILSQKGVFVNMRWCYISMLTSIFHIAPTIKAHDSYIFRTGLEQDVSSILTERGITVQGACQVFCVSFQSALFIYTCLPFLRSGLKTVLIFYPSPILLMLMDTPCPIWLQTHQDISTLVPPSDGRTELILLLELCI